MNYHRSKWRKLDAMKSKEIFKAFIEIYGQTYRENSEFGATPSVLKKKLGLQKSNLLTNRIAPLLEKGLVIKQRPKKDQRFIAYRINYRKFFDMLEIIPPVMPAFIEKIYNDLGETDVIGAYKESLAKKLMSATIRVRSKIFYRTERLSNSSVSSVFKNPINLKEFIEAAKLIFVAQGEMVLRYGSEGQKTKIGQDIGIPWDMD